MKKGLFFAILLAFVTFSMSAQSVRWVNDSERGYAYPVGVCTWQDVQTSLCYDQDMAVFYDNYDPMVMNMADMARVCRDVFPGYQLQAVCYFGGWNNDCHEFLPAFMRWIEVLSSDFNFIVDYTLVGVDKDLTSGVEFYDVARIHNLPTIQLTLVKKDGEVVKDEVKLGEFSGDLHEDTLERELYMILARYMKYHNR